MDYAGLICSSSDCREELEEVLEVYKKLLEDIKSLKESRVSVGHGITPLINGARGLETLLETIRLKLEEAGLNAEDSRVEVILKGGESEAQALASLLLRRAFFDIVKDEIKDLEWSNGRCPVCGMLPVLGITRREKGYIFSRDILDLRCSCGYRREYDSLKCPSCGARGKDVFEYYLVGRVTYRVCKRCNHVLGIVEETPLADLDLVTIAILYGVTRLLKNDTSREGTI